MSLRYNTTPDRLVTCLTYLCKIFHRNAPSRPNVSSCTSLIYADYHRDAPSHQKSRRLAPTLISLCFPGGWTHRCQHNIHQHRELQICALLAVSLSRFSCHVSYQFISLCLPRREALLLLSITSSRSSPRSRDTLQCRCGQPCAGAIRADGAVGNRSPFCSHRALSRG